MRIQRDIHIDTEKNKSALFIVIGIVLLIFGVLGGLGWAAFATVRLLWRWLQELVYTVSAMDTVIVIALISGTITIFGLIVNSMISLHIKRSESQFKRKAVLLRKLETPYNQFVDMLFDMVEKKEDAQNIDEELRTRLIRDMSREIILYGSDKIVRKWSEYRKHASTFTTEQHLYYLEGILHIIREDLGIKKGELSSGELLSLFVNDIETIADYTQSHNYNFKLGKWKFVLDPKIAEDLEAEEKS